MDTMTTDETGARYLQARTDHGYTQEQLAELAGITANTVRAIEQGRPVRDASRAAVAAVLGLATGTYSNDVETIRDLVGQWLQPMPRAERLAAQKKIMQVIFNHTSSTPTEDH